MALVTPFRGYRFNPAIAGDLNLVVTQPYDKIPAELQRDYYGRSAHNVVRITRNEEKTREPESDYPEAGATFRRWLSEGVLVQDPKPAIYAYSQEYRIEEETRIQLGFIALIDLELSARGIMPHERTMDEPKQDRLRLMRQLEANDDLIYTLYTDERFQVNRVLQEQTSGRPPDIEVRDDYQVDHRLWVISDGKAVRLIQNAMVPEELFIADGHHRFETSIAFMRECKARGWKALGSESFNKRMIACFNSAGDGTTILPTHRMIRDLPGFDSARMLRESEAFFEVEPMPSAEELWRRMRKGRGLHVFGFFPADSRRPSLLTLKEEGRVDSLMLAHGEAYRHLDVSILHTLLLEKILGINEQKLVAQAHVDYVRERSEALRAVEGGKYQAAFFLNPTSVEQVQRVALLGERMPQKSTDFYPKLLTGLVFMLMQILK